MKIRDCLYSLFSIIAGSLNYILFRSNVMFLLPFGFSHNSIIELDTTSVLGRFILYNLSDALWAMAILFFVSGQQQRFIRICGLVIPPLMELAQYFLLIPGTFDVIDLTIYLIITISFLIKWEIEKRTQRRSSVSSDCVPS